MPSTFKIDRGARHLITFLEARNHNAYVVGGCVRDFLMGKEPHDWDICTSATPDVVCELMDYLDISVYKTGIQHGTVTVRWWGESYEITTFRTDGEYSDNRRPDSVTFVNDVNEDLSRRDFTINAMAYNDYEGLIDPWGGEADLNDKLIRCVGNPDDRFGEDALRIMRALRFASTYGFKIEEGTAAAIHRNKDLLKNIAAERIQSELCKMLCGEGVLDILLEYSDVMAVIIPELKPCVGFEQTNPYHKYDVYSHIAHAVANYKGSDISIKMALLLHDVGKPECYTEDEAGGHFRGHSVPGARITKEVVERLKFDNKTKAEIVDLVLHHDSIIDPIPRTVRRWLYKIGPELLDKLIFVRIADIYAQSGKGLEDRRDRILGVKLIAKQILRENQCFTVKNLAVTGYDIMNHCGIESGPNVGRVLNWLLGRVIDGSIENKVDELIQEAKRYLTTIL